MSWYTQKEGDWVADVSEDELKGQSWIVDVEESSPPAEETVDQTDESNNAKKSSNDHTGNLDTEPSTVGESVKCVGGFVFVIIWDNDTSGGDGLFFFGISKFADCERSWNRHDARRDERLRVQTKTNVCDKDGTSNCSETAAHDLVKLGQSQMWDEWSDQHSRFTLTDEGSGSCDNSFSTRNSERPIEEGRELDDKPLEKAAVVEELDERNEEDDRWNDTDQEPRQLGNTGGGQESSTLLSKTEQLSGEVGDELEDVVAGTSTEHKQSNDELGQHATDDSVPLNLASIPGGSVQTCNHNNQTEERNGSVCTSVVLAFLGNEGSKYHDDDSSCGSEWLMQLLWDQVVDLDHSVIPDEGHGNSHDGDRDMESDESDGDG